MRENCDADRCESRNIFDRFDSFEVDLGAVGDESMISGWKIHSFWLGARVEDDVDGFPRIFDQRTVDVKADCSGGQFSPGHRGDGLVDFAFSANSKCRMAFSKFYELAGVFGGVLEIQGASPIELVNCITGVVGIVVSAFCPADFGAAF